MAGADVTQGEPRFRRGHPASQDPLIPHQPVHGKRAAWSLDFTRDPRRVTFLESLHVKDPPPRWDGSEEPSRLQVPAHDVLAGMRFTGSPGREDEAARAWAFELKVYFLRGVGEQPQVSHDGSVYTVVGLMRTTHPWDTPGEDGIVWFS